MKKKDQVIAELENKLAQSTHASKKELKISTTIEELRMTMEKQVEEKERSVRVYQ